MTLRINCSTNPDLVNLFYQEDVEKEMEETGVSAKGDRTGWLKYILNQVFENEVLPPRVYDAIVSGDVQSITFKTKDENVAKVVLSR